jgi:hypothetical protein
MKNVRCLEWAAALAVGLSFSLSALAAPSWNVTGLTVGATDAPKVVAAFDTLFSSKFGSELPGRVVLRANLADGPNPETHSVLVLGQSVAEREAFQAELYASSEWAQFLETMSTLSPNPGSTSRGTILWNAGDLSDKDVVWINHFLTVSEPAVLLNAMQTYNASAMGQQAPGQLHLSAVYAGGPTAPSHIISIGYESEAEMAAWAQKQQADPAYRVLVDTMLSVATYHGATMQRDGKAWGKSAKDAASIK